MRRGSVSVLGRENVRRAYWRAAIRISDMVEHQPQPRLRFVLCSETVIFVHRTEILEHRELEVTSSLVDEK